MSNQITFTREKTRYRVIRFLLYFVITFFVIAGRSAQWVLNEWGDLTLDEVIFTMTQPLNGTDSGIIMSYFTYAVLPGIVILTILIVVEHLFLMKKQPPKGKKVKGEDGKKTTVPAELTEEMEQALRADHEKKDTKVRKLFRMWLLPVCAIAAAVFGLIQIVGLWNKLGVSEHLSSLGPGSKITMRIRRRFS